MGLSKKELQASAIEKQGLRVARGMVDEVESKLAQGSPKKWFLGKMRCCVLRYVTQPVAVQAEGHLKRMLGDGFEIHRDPFHGGDDVVWVEWDREGGGS